MSSRDGCGWPAMALACSSSMVWKSASRVDIAGLLKRKGGRLASDPPAFVGAILLRSLLRRVAQHGLGLQELVEGVVAPLAPAAAPPGTAKGIGQIAAAAA